MIAILISAIIFAYILLILLFWLGWEKAQPCRDSAGEKKAVSIIVAVRNEAENISKLITDIKNQDYPDKLIEMIVVDDHSTDTTVDIIEQLAGDSKFRIELIKLDVGEGKKAALRKGIAMSANELILTTDGDCRVREEWVSSMMACFDNPLVQMVSGPVRLYPQNNFWQRIQGIEFSSLISSGAATLTLGTSTMANAANLAYRKSAYIKVSGITANNTSSGDDIFLLHEVSRAYSNGILFCRDTKAIVDTESTNSLKAFYHQRKRWAGKWQFYHDLPTIFLATFVFLVNLTVLALPLLVVFNTLTLVLAANLFVVKFVFEFIFLREVQKFFNSRILLHEFSILAIVYPAYVTFVALAGLMGKYIWKDRVTK